jgi:hypothetical protein
LKSSHKPRFAPLTLIAEPDLNRTGNHTERIIFLSIALLQYYKCSLSTHLSCFPSRESTRRSRHLSQELGRVSCVGGFAEQALERSCAWGHGMVPPAGNASATRGGGEMVQLVGCFQCVAPGAQGSFCVRRRSGWHAYGRPQEEGDSRSFS